MCKSTQICSPRARQGRLERKLLLDPRGYLHCRCGKEAQSMLRQCRRKPAGGLSLPAAPVQDTRWLARHRVPAVPAAQPPWCVRIWAPDDMHAAQRKSKQNPVPVSTLLTLHSADLGHQRAHILDGQPVRKALQQRSSSGSMCRGLHLGQTRRCVHALRLTGCRRPDAAGSCQPNAGGAPGNARPRFSCTTPLVKHLQQRVRSAPGPTLACWRR